MPSYPEQRIHLVLQNLHRLEDLAGLTPHPEWAPNDHPGISALVWFYCRPWFQRLWVIQEVNAMSNVTVLCGNIQISWDHVGLVATFVPTTEFFY
jgi:hypothetical protein